MQMTLKEFRHLAQGTQSLVTSVAIIATVALAWQVLKTYRDGQQARIEDAFEQ